MRRLTEVERMALVEVGEPGEGPVPDEVFEQFSRWGWGYWADDPEVAGGRLWFVTAAGRRALEYDTLARDAP